MHVFSPGHRAQDFTMTRVKQAHSAPRLLTTVARWAEMPLEKGLPQVASLPSGPHCLADEAGNEERKQEELGVQAKAGRKLCIQ